MAIDKSNNDTVVFPSVPQQDIEFETFNLYFRQQKEQIYIEAIGPHGERVEVPTDLSKLDRNASSEQFGKALMPESVRKIYLNLLEGTSKKNKGLRIQLDFTGATSIYASLPWEKARLDGKTIITSPKQTITRTVASPIPALPFEASQKPYRILVVLANPDFVTIEGKKHNLTKLKLLQDYIKIKEAVKPLLDQDMLEIILLEGREATLEKIIEKLNETEIHSLYFTGHSDNQSLNGIKEEKSDGYIILDSPSGEGVFYTGSEFVKATNLSQNDSEVRMVFLNSNLSAFGKNGGEGLGEAMLRAGIPVVIAYNALAWEDAAPVFASAFFSTLVKLNSLELAMYAARKTVTESPFKSGASWSDVVLLSRVREGKKAFAGELVGKVATYVNQAGELVVMEQKDNQSLTDLFTQLSKNLEAEVKKIHDIEQYAEVQNHITDAHRELRKNPEAAIDILSEASLHAARALKKQEVEEDNARITQEKQRALSEARSKRLKKIVQQRSIVLSMAGLMFVLIGVLSYYMEGTEEIGILGLPISIVLWSFIGGVGATLYAFVGTQKQVETEPFRLDWLIGRPLVGIIMGCVVYLTVATSISALTSVDISETATGNKANPDAKPYLLWALAFLGGFSDKFALLLFSNLVGKYTTGEKDKVLNENEEPLPPKPVEKEKVVENKPKKELNKTEKPHKGTNAEVKEKKEEASKEK